MRLFGTVVGEDPTSYVILALWAVNCLLGMSKIKRKYTNPARGIRDFCKQEFYHAANSPFSKVSQCRTFSSLNEPKNNKNKKHVQN